MEEMLRQRLDKLLKAYAHRYNIEREVDVPGGHYPAVATFYLRDENYLLSRKKVLNATEQFDHTFFCLAEHLTAEELQRQIDLSLKEGMRRIHPNKEHMSSYVTLVILAEVIDPEAKRLLKKTRFHKNFRLALHGWMEYHIAAMECSTNSFLSNPAGRGARKLLEANFTPGRE